MSTNESAASTQAVAPVAKEAPTEQQTSRPGTPKRFAKGQTVCNEKNEKGKPCNGHLKQVRPVGEDARQHLRGDDLLYKCHTCGALYTGPPLGHVRDPKRQRRVVETELAAILEAAGGTLPAFKRNERGVLVPVNEEQHGHAPAEEAAAKTAAPPKPAAAAKPAPPATPAPAPASPAASAAPAGETPEERRARMIAEARAKAAEAAAKKAAGGGGEVKPAAPRTPLSEEEKAARLAAAKAKTAARTVVQADAEAEPRTAEINPPQASATAGTDSSPAADAHRLAAEAQASTGQASAAPMSPAASTASPAAGAETPSDLAPEASTELTPGAPKDERGTKES